jgi:hypothetical protein
MPCNDDEDDQEAFPAAHPTLAGNSLDYTDRCMEIMTSEGAAVKEMEAAAISWVAALFPTPFLCVKVRSQAWKEADFLANLCVEGRRPGKEGHSHRLTARWCV